MTWDDISSITISMPDIFDVSNLLNINFCSSPPDKLGIERERFKYPKPMLSMEDNTLSNIDSSQPFFYEFT
ncbi:hypothetical protein OS31_04280 [Dickeya oryzae]